MPTGQHLDHLYDGSGHLHQLNLDGQLISDMERDDLHREVLRTQGKLTSCFGCDAMGRKARQFASALSTETFSQRCIVARLVEVQTALPRRFLVQHPQALLQEMLR